MKKHLVIPISILIGLSLILCTIVRCCEINATRPQPAKIVLPKEAKYPELFMELAGKRDLNFKLEETNNKMSLHIFGSSTFERTFGEGNYYQERNEMFKEAYYYIVNK